MDISKTSVILTLATLTACGGSGTGSPSSLGNSGGGPIARDCGIQSMYKDFDFIPRSSATRTDRIRDGVFQWDNPKMSMHPAYNGFGWSSTFKVSNGEFVEPCSWLSLAFGEHGRTNWEGETSEFGNFPQNNKRLYFVPSLYLEFEKPTYRSLDDWRADGQPVESNTKLVSAKMYVEYAESSNNQFFTRFLIDNNIKQQTSETRLSCDQPFHVAYNLSRFEELGQKYPHTCEEIETGNAQDPLDYNCLTVTPANDIQNCTFTTSKILIPDNKGNFFKAAIAGKLESIGGGEYRLSVTQADFL